MKKGCGAESGRGAYFVDLELIREKERFLNLPEETERETVNLWWEDQ
jgi:hypothetical protein